MTEQQYSVDDAIALIYREARLLDEGHYEEWLNLYTPESYYWMPAEWLQTDPVMQPSLMYEDYFLMKVRVQRLAAARTFSQKPKSRSCHVLQQPQIEPPDSAGSTDVSFSTWTPFHYTETRGDNAHSLSGWLKHQLTIANGELKIKLKRIDLLNFDAPLPAIQLFI